MPEDETLEDINVRAKAIEDFNDQNTSIYLTTKPGAEESPEQNNQFFYIDPAQIKLSDISYSEDGRVKLNSVFGPNEYRT